MNNEDTVKPLNDDDVNNEMKLIEKMDKKFTNELFILFSNTLSSILSITLEKCSNDDSEYVEIIRLRRIINLVPVEEKFIRTKDKVWNVRKQILDKNEKYFIEKDYSKLIKKDHNQYFIETLTDIVKNRFDELNNAEKDLYWQKAAILLNCVGKYKKAVMEINKKTHLV